MQQLKKYIFLALTVAPLFTLAATSISEIATTIRGILGNYIIPLLFTIALVYFLVGVIKYIASAGDENKRKEGTQMMLYGIIGLFVMVAVWGLVNLIWNTLRLDTGAPDYPQF